MLYHLYFLPSRICTQIKYTVSWRYGNIFVSSMEAPLLCSRTAQIYRLIIIQPNSSYSCEVSGQNLTIRSWSPNLLPACVCASSRATHTVSDASRKRYLGRWSTPTWARASEHHCPVFLHSPVAKLKNLSHQTAKQQAVSKTIFGQTTLTAANICHSVWLAAFSSTSFGHCQCSVTSSVPFTCCLALDVELALVRPHPPTR